MGLDGPIELKKGTVVPVDERVDLEEAAKFDFREWLDSKGIGEKDNV